MLLNHLWSNMRGEWVRAEWVRAGTLTSTAAPLARKPRVLSNVLLLLKETIGEPAAKRRRVEGWRIRNRYANCAYHPDLGCLSSWPGNYQTA